MNPKTESIGPRNTTRRKCVFLAFLFNHGGFKEFKLFQNGELMIPHRLQYFLSIFRTTKKTTKSGPSKPVFITKIPEDIQEIWKDP